jgi:DNA-binding response OmpR family regulator
MRVLVVEDEPGIADFIERGLRAEGYDVAVVADGVEAVERALDPDVDLVVLDVMLPGQDGLAVLDAVRPRRPGLPIIALTARGAVADRIAGLDAGATDYVTKPFSFDELAARVRAQLRTPQLPDRTTLEAAGIRVDLLSRRVTRDGQPVQLSARELDLLAFLLRHPDEVLSRARILAAVWGRDDGAATNVVDVYVGYLRRKLEATGERAPIETRRSAGYRLVTRG